MDHAYAVVATMVIAGGIVFVPIWRRGGRAALVETIRRTVPLFFGLTVWVVVLVVLVQTPARASVEVVLAASTASLAAYWLTRTEVRRSSTRTALLVLVLILSVAIVIALIAR